MLMLNKNVSRTLQYIIFFVLFLFSEGRTKHCMWITSLQTIHILYFFTSEENMCLKNVNHFSPIVRKHTIGHIRWMLSDIGTEMIYIRIFTGHISIANDEKFFMQTTKTDQTAQMGRMIYVCCFLMLWLICLLLTLSSTCTIALATKNIQINFFRGGFRGPLGVQSNPTNCLWLIISFSWEILDKFGTIFVLFNKSI